MESCAIMATPLSVRYRWAIGHSPQRPLEMGFLGEGLANRPCLTSRRESLMPIHMLYQIDGELFRIDPASGAVLAAIDTPEAGNAFGIAVGKDAVWVASQELKAVLKVDPISNRVVQRIQVDGAPEDVVELGGAFVGGFSPGRCRGAGESGHRGPGSPGEGKPAHEHGGGALSPGSRSAFQRPPGQQPPSCAPGPGGSSWHLTLQRTRSLQRSKG